MLKSRNPLRVAIVGLQHLHPVHYMPLFEKVSSTQVVAVVEENSKLRNEFCQNYNVTGYETLNNMLKNASIEMVAIFLPHDECPSAAVACARKGIHLMVEKPMSSDVRGAVRIVKAAKENRVKITTGYLWRFHPVATEFHRLIQSGVLGKIISLEGRCAAGRLTRYIQGNSAWMLDKNKSGGGPMYNLGVHWIDLFRYLINDEVVEVSGQNVKINKKYNIEDNSFSHLRFSKGAIGALNISYTVPDSFPHGRDLYVAVLGTKGAISWSPAYEGEKDILHVCSDDSSFQGSPNRAIEFELTPEKGYSGIMGLAYVKSFAEAIMQNKKPFNTGEDGVIALKVVEAIYKSTSLKKWVKVRK